MSEVIQAAIFSWDRWWHDLISIPYGSFADSYNDSSCIAPCMQVDASCVTMFVDAAFDVCRGKGAIGVVITSAEGGILGSGYKCIQARSAQEAELVVVEGALNLARLKGYRRIIVKGDCQIIMKALAGNVHSPDLSWQSNTIFQNILASSLTFELVYFIWIKRSCNVQAHEVAKWAYCHLAMGPSLDCMLDAADAPVSL
ncbi:hypothetical protein FRX31_032204 [Thalictrum thalictroides]|uniref:RNase H type-1 domain-containing protein n=1 Tax=Thalictrum thalictroides TaxID=46969 RepID=A0A7J6V1F9_THATH|nr:hypothetical protein FRX31_032204 [Thalictrum thalictroides]